MINFRLDGQSAVPPYLQIVQQVRQALRMGVLEVGDRLPTVREVVAATPSIPTRRSRPTAIWSARAWCRPGPGTARSC